MVNKKSYIAFVLHKDGTPLMPIKNPASTHYYDFLSGILRDSNHLFLIIIISPSLKQTFNILYCFHFFGIVL